MADSKPSASAESNQVAEEKKNIAEAKDPRDEKKPTDAPSAEKKSASPDQEPRDDKKQTRAATAEKKEQKKAAPATPPPTTKPSDSPARQAKSDKPQEFDREKIQQIQQTGRPDNPDFFRSIAQYLPQGSNFYYFQNVSANEMLFSRQAGAPSMDVHQAPRRDFAQVETSEIERVNQVYQRHAAFPAALAKLQSTHCVALKGKPNIGKRAMAIRLALEILGENPEIQMLSPDADPSQQILEPDLKSGAVYLIDGLLPGKGRALTSDKISAMLDALVKKNAYLIICALLDVPFPASISAEIISPILTLPAVLFEIHLEHYGQHDPEVITTVLHHPRIAKLRANELPPGRVNDLAQKIAERLQDGENPDQVLGNIVTAIEEQVQTWFNETAEDVEESAFRIAVAALSGARYTFVDQAAQNLAKRLRPEPVVQSKTEPQPYISPLKKKLRTSRIQAAHARLVERSVKREYSDQAAVQTVELANIEYTTALLKYIWLEIDEWRQPVLNWLCDYALQGENDLRLRAAGAIAALANLDFEFISAHIFGEWAIAPNDDADTRRARYRALTESLGTLIWNDERVDDVLGLLRVWIEDEKGKLNHLGNAQKQSLQWAAGRVLTTVGLRYPREALNQWRKIFISASAFEFRILQTDDEFRLSFAPNPLHQSIIDAIISMFDRATGLSPSVLPDFMPVFYEEALKGLDAWIQLDVKEKIVPKFGMPLFLLLCPIGLPTDDGKSELTDWPPAMLIPVNNLPDSAYRRSLCSLLRRALNDRDRFTSEWAIEILRDWTARADKRKSVEDSLVALFQEMLASPDLTESERNRIQIRLSRWANHPRQPLPVAGRLLKILKLD